MSRPGAPRTRAGMLLLGAALVAVAVGFPGVDFSTIRYFVFVAGGALTAAGFLVLSLRGAAILALVFVAAIAAEGPLLGGDAAAVRLVDRIGLPGGFVASARGFEGSGRGLPYRVLVGPEGGVDPATVTLPRGFTREPVGYDFAHTVYGRPIESDWTGTFLQGGYAPIASWRGLEGGRTCHVDLEAADPQRVMRAVSEADPGLRSRFQGRAVVRVVSFCPSGAIPGLPRPGSKGRIAPATDMTPEQVGGPR